MHDDICLETVDGNAGLEGNTCFLQSRPPLLQAYRAFHTLTKKDLKESCTYEKINFFAK